MYSKIIRPLLFRFSAESIHHLLVALFRILRYIPGGRALLRRCYTINHPSLEREVFGVTFSNPVGLAAGFDKNAGIFDEIGALGFGFVEVGTITPKGQPGNPQPRLFRLPKDKALINRMGFNNIGVEGAVRNLGRCRRPRCIRETILGGNLGKNTTTPNEEATNDYLQLFRRLYDYVSYFVINVSCPNVANLSSLQDEAHLRKILLRLTEFRRGQNEYRPILLKISPDLTLEQIDQSILVMMESGIDGIVATNTTTSREGLNTPFDVVSELGRGGLSGGPLSQRSLEIVRYIRQKAGESFPIIGVGGIMSVEDALAMLDAGASLIEVYTGFIYNGPGFAKKICKALKQRSLQKISSSPALSAKEVMQTPETPIAPQQPGDKRPLDTMLPSAQYITEAHHTISSVHQPSRPSR